MSCCTEISLHILYQIWFINQQCTQNNNVENCEIVANKCNIPEIRKEMDLIYSFC